MWCCYGNKHQRQMSFSPPANEETHFARVSSDWQAHELSVSCCHYEALQLTRYWRLTCPAVKHVMQSRQKWPKKKKKALRSLCITITFHSAFTFLPLLMTYGAGLHQRWDVAFRNSDVIQSRKASQPWRWTGASVLPPQRRLRVCSHMLGYI